MGDFKPWEGENYKKTKTQLWSTPDDDEIEIGQLFRDGLQVAELRLSSALRRDWEERNPEEDDG
ncbi:MAG: hypothetical protein KAS32_10375 [Candidatus Peribacteraceae bacterium]|nr:hypothetical protein [Candidatus Peribacteraceae bacterium]